ncbi:hypothetical protein ZWY2020_016826 [Hordeum vulgare]|nr:hypothetical protein ZWY2020_016826 [Hordeum vulgare]
MAAPHHASPAQPLPFLAPLVALLFLVAATTTATAAADGVPVGNGGMMHLHFYFHEIYTAGPNGTTAAVASPPAGAGGSSFRFGSVSVVDDMLLEGADPASRLIGRAQELTVAASLSEGAIRRHPKRSTEAWGGGGGGLTGVGGEGVNRRCLEQGGGRRASTMARARRRSGSLAASIASSSGA